MSHPEALVDEINNISLDPAHSSFLFFYPPLVLYIYMLNCSSGMTAKVNVLQVETNTVHILRLRQWDWVSLQMCIPPAN